MSDTTARHLGPVPRQDIPKGTTPFSVLPDDARRMLIGYMDEASLFAAACSNKEMHHLFFDDDKFWATVIRKDFGPVASKGTQYLLYKRLREEKEREEGGSETLRCCSRVVWNTDRERQKRIDEHQFCVVCCPDDVCERHPCPTSDPECASNSCFWCCTWRDCDVHNQNGCGHRKDADGDYVLGTNSGCDRYWCSSCCHMRNARDQMLNYAVNATLATPTSSCCHEKDRFGVSLYNKNKHCLGQRCHGCPNHVEHVQCPSFQRKYYAVLFRCQQIFSK